MLTEEYNLATQVIETFMSNHKMIHSVEFIQNFMCDSIQLRFKLKNPLEDVSVLVPLPIPLLDKTKYLLEYMEDKFRHTVSECLYKKYSMGTLTVETQIWDYSSATKEQLMQFTKPDPFSFDSSLLLGQATVHKSTSNYGQAINVKNTALDLVPGLSVKVKHPMTKVISPIHGIIVDLNENHDWTREEIADWLESLDVDLQFKTEESK